jgi:diguanylate cyclase (GGDEF)-like protein/PAS domain S-box-containing protein
MTEPGMDRPSVERLDTRFAKVFAFSPVALALIGEDGTVRDANPALSRLLDLPKERICGRRMEEFTHADDREDALATIAAVAAGERDSVELRKRMSGGDRRAVPVRVTVFRLEEPDGGQHRLAQVEDVSAGSELDQVRREASEDPLTGVANRRALHRHLDPLLIEQATDVESEEPAGGESSAAWSLLFVDLDDFKRVNDCHGHGVGDQVLVTVARRLSRITRDADLVCRLGGDEFVLLLQTAASEDVDRAKERVRRSLAQPVRVAGFSLRISASIGSAVPRRDDSAEVLLDRADAAMYRDKHSRAR